MNCRVNLKTKVIMWENTSCIDRDAKAPLPSKTYHHFKLWYPVRSPNRKKSFSCLTGAPQPGDQTVMKKITAKKIGENTPLMQCVLVRCAHNHRMAKVFVLYLRTRTTVTRFTSAETGITKLTFPSSPPSLKRRKNKHHFKFISTHNFYILQFIHKSSHWHLSHIEPIIV